MKNFKLAIYAILFFTVSSNIISSEYLGSKKVVGLSKATLQKMLENINQEITNNENRFKSLIEKGKSSKGITSIVNKAEINSIKKKITKLEVKKKEIQKALNKLS